MTVCKFGYVVAFAGLVLVAAWPVVAAAYVINDASLTACVERLALSCHSEPQQAPILPHQDTASNAHGNASVLSGLWRCSALLSGAQGPPAPLGVILWDAHAAWLLPALQRFSAEQGVPLAIELAPLEALPLRLGLGGDLEGLEGPAAGGGGAAPSAGPAGRSNAALWLYASSATQGLAQAGLLADLSGLDPDASALAPALAQRLGAYPPGALDRGGGAAAAGTPPSPAGPRVAVPLEGGGLALMVRTDAAAAAGMREVPQTWTQLADWVAAYPHRRAEAAAAGGGGAQRVPPYPICVAPGPGGSSEAWLQAVWSSLAQLRGPDHPTHFLPAAPAAAPSLRPLIDSPAAAAALRIAAQLRAAAAPEPQPEGAGAGAAPAGSGLGSGAFARGECAVALAGFTAQMRLLATPSARAALNVSAVAPAPLPGSELYWRPPRQPLTASPPLSGAGAFVEADAATEADEAGAPAHAASAPSPLYRCTPCACPHATDASAPGAALPLSAPETWAERLAAASAAASAVAAAVAGTGGVGSSGADGDAWAACSWDDAGEGSEEGLQEGGTSAPAAPSALPLLVNRAPLLSPALLVGGVSASAPPVMALLAWRALEALAAPQPPGDTAGAAEAAPLRWALPPRPSALDPGDPACLSAWAAAGVPPGAARQALPLLRAAWAHPNLALGLRMAGHGPYSSRLASLLDAAAAGAVAAPPWSSAAAAAATQRDPRGETAGAAASPSPVPLAAALAEAAADLAARYPAQTYLPLYRASLGLGAAERPNDSEQVSIGRAPPPPPAPGAAVDAAGEAELHRRAPALAGGLVGAAALAAAVAAAVLLVRRRRCGGCGGCGKMAAAVAGAAEAACGGRGCLDAGGGGAGAAAAGGGGLGGGGRRGVLVPRPGVEVALVCTDIESSTTLWELLPADVVARALDAHHRTVRRLALRHGGYESATEGDSFVLAFPTVRSAVAFGLELQTQLLAVPWPRQLLEQEICRPVYTHLTPGYPFSHAAAAATGPSGPAPGTAAPAPTDTGMRWPPAPGMHGPAADAPAAPGLASGAGLRNTASGAGFGGTGGGAGGGCDRLPGFRRGGVTGPGGGGGRSALLHALTSLSGSGRAVATAALSALGGGGSAPRLPPPALSSYTPRSVRYAVAPPGACATAATDTSTATATVTVDVSSSNAFAHAPAACSPVSDPESPPLHPRPPPPPRSLPRTRPGAAASGHLYPGEGGLPPLPATPTPSVSTPGAVATVPSPRHPAAADDLALGPFAPSSFWAGGGGAAGAAAPGGGPAVRWLDRCRSADHAAALAALMPPGPGLVPGLGLGAERSGGLPAPAPAVVPAAGQGLLRAGEWGWVAPGAGGEGDGCAGACRVRPESLFGGAAGTAAAGARAAPHLVAWSPVSPDPCPAAAWDPLGLPSAGPASPPPPQPPPPCTPTDAFSGTDRYPGPFTCQDPSQDPYVAQAVVSGPVPGPGAGPGPALQDLLGPRYCTLGPRGDTRGSVGSGLGGLAGWEAEAVGGGGYSAVYASSAVSGGTLAAAAAAVARAETWGWGAEEVDDVAAAFGLTATGYTGYGGLGLGPGPGVGPSPGLGGVFAELYWSNASHAIATATAAFASAIGASVGGPEAAPGSPGADEPGAQQAGAWAPPAAAGPCAADSGAQVRTLGAAMHAAAAGEGGAAEAGPRRLLFRGLRVRVGISLARPAPAELQYNAAAARMVYGGPCVVAARATADAAQGGCVVLSGRAHAALAAECSGLGGRPPGTLVLQLGVTQAPPPPPAPLPRAQPPSWHHAALALASPHDANGPTGGGTPLRYSLDPGPPYRSRPASTASGSVAYRHSYDHSRPSPPSPPLHRLPPPPPSGTPGSRRDELFPAGPHALPPSPEASPVRPVSRDLLRPGGTPTLPGGGGQWRDEGAADGTPRTARGPWPSPSPSTRAAATPRLAKAAPRTPAPSAPAPSPDQLLGLERLFCVTSPPLAPRLALLPPPRLPKERPLLQDVYAAPLGRLSLAVVRVPAAAELLAWGGAAEGGGGGGGGGGGAGPQGPAPTSASAAAEALRLLLGTAAAALARVEGGYLVSASPGELRAAFPHPSAALGWALGLRAELLAAPWPEELLAHELGEAVWLPEGEGEGEGGTDREGRAGEEAPGLGSPRASGLGLSGRRSSLAALSRAASRDRSSFGHRPRPGTGTCTAAGSVTGTGPFQRPPSLSSSGVPAGACSTPSGGAGGPPAVPRPGRRASLPTAAALAAVWGALVSQASAHPPTVPCGPQNRPSTARAPAPRPGPGLPGADTGPSPGARRGRWSVDIDPEALQPVSRQPAAAPLRRHRHSIDICPLGPRPRTHTLPHPEPQPQRRPSSQPPPPAHVPQPPPQPPPLQPLATPMALAAALRLTFNHRPDRPASLAAPAPSFRPWGGRRRSLDCRPGPQGPPGPGAGGAHEAVAEAEAEAEAAVAEAPARGLAALEALACHLASTSPSAAAAQAADAAREEAEEMEDAAAEGVEEVAAEEPAVDPTQAQADEGAAGLGPGEAQGCLEGQPEPTGSVLGALWGPGAEEAAADVGWQARAPAPAVLVPLPAPAAAAVPPRLGLLRVPQPGQAPPLPSPVWAALPPEGTPSRGLLLLRGLRIHVGVSTGSSDWAVSARSHALTYTGRLVSRAVRLSLVAASGQVLCDAATQRQLAAEAAARQVAAAARQAAEAAGVDPGEGQAAEQPRPSLDRQAAPQPLLQALPQAPADGARPGAWSTLRRHLSLREPRVRQAPQSPPPEPASGGNAAKAAALSADMAGAGGGGGGWTGSLRRCASRLEGLLGPHGAAWTPLGAEPEPATPALAGAVPLPAPAGSLGAPSACPSPGTEAGAGGRSGGVLAAAARLLLPVAHSAWVQEPPLPAPHAPAPSLPPAAPAAQLYSAGAASGGCGSPAQEASASLPRGAAPCAAACASPTRGTPSWDGGGRLGGGGGGGRLGAEDLSLMPLAPPGNHRLSRLWAPQGVFVCEFAPRAAEAAAQAAAARSLAHTPSRATSALCTPLPPRPRPLPHPAALSTAASGVCSGGPGARSATDTGMGTSTLSRTGTGTGSSRLLSPWGASDATGGTPGAWPAPNRPPGTRQAPLVRTVSAHRAGMPASGGAGGFTPGALRRGFGSGAQLAAAAAAGLMGLSPYHTAAPYYSSRGPTPSAWPQTGAPQPPRQHLKPLTPFPGHHDAPPAAPGPQPQYTPLQPQHLLRPRAPHPEIEEEEEEEEEAALAPARGGSAALEGPWRPVHALPSTSPGGAGSSGGAQRTSGSGSTPTPTPTPAPHPGLAAAWAAAEHRTGVFPAVSVASSNPAPPAAPPVAVPEPAPAPVPVPGRAGALGRSHSDRGAAIAALAAAAERAARLGASPSSPWPGPSGGTGGAFSPFLAPAYGAVGGGGAEAAGGCFGYGFSQAAAAAGTSPGGGGTFHSDCFTGGSPSGTATLLSAGSMGSLRLSGLSGLSGLVLLRHRSSLEGFAHGPHPALPLCERVDEGDEGAADAGGLEGPASATPRARGPGADAEGSVGWCTGGAAGPPDLSLRAGVGARESAELYASPPQRGQGQGLEVRAAEAQPFDAGAAEGGGWSGGRLRSWLPPVPAAAHEPAPPASAAASPPRPVPVPVPVPRRTPSSWPPPPSARIEAAAAAAAAPFAFQAPRAEPCGGDTREGPVAQEWEREATLARQGTSGCAGVDAAEARPRNASSWLAQSPGGSEEEEETAEGEGEGAEQVDGVFELLISPRRAREGLLGSSGSGNGSGSWGPAAAGAAVGAAGSPGARGGVPWRPPHPGSPGGSAWPPSHQPVPALLRQRSQPHAAPSLPLPLPQPPAPSQRSSVPQPPAPGAGRALRPAPPLCPASGEGSAHPGDSPGSAGGEHLSPLQPHTGSSALAPPSLAALPQLSAPGFGANSPRRLLRECDSPWHSRAWEEAPEPAAASLARGAEGGAGVSFPLVAPAPPVPGVRRMW